LKPVLVIDSGLLIATLFEKDRYHLQAVKGFQQLQQEEQTLILPLPIVFEVHRWLLQQQSSQLAQAVFTAIDRSFQIYAISESDFSGIKQIILDLSNWKGTLADASVVYVAMKLGCPVWTLDYRDLSRFSKLTFWTPQ